MILDSVLHLKGEHDQGLAVFRSQGSWNPIDDAQGSKGGALRALQGNAGIETTLRPTRDQGIVGEARVVAGIMNNENIVLSDRVSAEGKVARGFGDFERESSFEPLTMGVDQCDQPYRRLANQGGEAGEVVVFPLGRRVEKTVPVQNTDTLDVVFENRSCH